MNPNNVPMVITGQVVVDQTKLEKKVEFFAQLDGCTYIFRNGHVARFEGGVYATDKTGEVEELKEVISKPDCYMYSNKPFEHIRKSDALIMKDVGGGGSNTGTLNTGLIRNMAGRN